MSFLPGVSRRSLLGWMAGQFAASAMGRALPASGATTAPNVIFVLMDDVGYGDLACTGNPIIKTPNIDALHAKSIRFTNYHVSPTCSPTRAALMTGRYSNATGVWHTINGRSILDPENITLADCFKSSGYRTGIYGKWHLGDNYPCRPHDRGFDDAVVCGGGGVWQTPDYFGNDDMDDSYLHNGIFQKYGGFSTDIFFRLAMDFMQKSHEDRRPFFCYLATPAAHAPTWAKEKDQRPYENVTGLDSPGFYGMIANIDENMGRLMSFLETSGLAKNTVLILSSDNGGWDGVKVFNASMRGIKGSAYDGGHRVPLFFYWPHGNMTGRRDVSTLTAHIDVLPTLVDLCGLKNRGKNVDGKSLLPLLRGEQVAWPDRTIVVDSQRVANLIPWKDTAVMTQRWRLVNTSEDGNPGAIELYDMAADPGQTKDVASQHPGVVASLKSRYQTWWQKVSARGDRYVRLAIGSPRESPTCLNCMDWYKNPVEVWNQGQIRTGPPANGFWALYVTRAGRYRFELRRWPREVDLAINSAYQDMKPNQREKTPGIAISADTANIAIGNIIQSKPINERDKYAVFDLDLPAGPAELQCTFSNTATHQERGAYYAYIQKI